MLSFYSPKKISYDGNKIGRGTVLHLGHGVLPVNNSASHIVKCSALVSMAETDFAPENSRRCAKIALGNKIASEPVWIANGPGSRSTTLEEQDKLAGFEQSIMPHMNAAYN